MADRTPRHEGAFSRTRESTRSDFHRPTPHGSRLRCRPRSSATGAAASVKPGKAQGEDGVRVKILPREVESHRHFLTCFEEGSEQGLIRDGALRVEGARTDATLIRCSDLG